MDATDTIGLDDYRHLVALDVPKPSHAPTGEVDLRIIAETIAAEPWARQLGIPVGAEIDRVRLRDLLTLRPPGTLPPDVVVMLDALFASEARKRVSVDADELPSLANDPATARHRHADRLVLRRGDITTLTADAIVNAANAQLLGCFHPGHACIDNAIHSTAGPELRNDCAVIMGRQGRPEPTGTAKITRAHHLPATYVLHTVGPIVRGPLDDHHEHLLSASYRACLDLALEVGGINSVAFCSISTGVFGYPIAPAANTAIRTVTAWLDDHPIFNGRVIFNVFSETDELAYQQAFRELEV